MPRTCTVCTHEDRAEINSALLAGTPLRNISKQFDLGHTALHRHKADHLPHSLLKAHEAGEVADGDRLALELTELKDDVHRLKGKAEKAGDYRTALTAVDKALKALELQAKLAQLIDERPQVNIINAEFAEFKTIVIDALADHPEAREQLVARMGELAGGKR